MDVPHVKSELEEVFPPEWFDAEGRFHLATDGVKEWLGQGDNRLLPAASLVYRTWLDATRDRLSIKKPLAEWLAVNGATEDFEALFRAWLRAGGKLKLFRKQVFEWVRSRRLERADGYLLKQVVWERVIPDDVALKILAWCSEFADDPDAIWRLTNLSAHVSCDLFEEAVRASQAVLDAIFAKPQLEDVTRSQVTNVLNNLSMLEYLGSYPASPDLDSLLRGWISHPLSFDAASYHPPGDQMRQFVARLLTALEGETGTPDLTRLLGWVNFWNERFRGGCKDLAKQLRSLKGTYERQRR